MEDHPGDEVLLDYLGECLSPDDADQVKAHLTWCRRCTGKLKELDVPLGFEVDPDPPPLPASVTRPIGQEKKAHSKLRIWLPSLLSAAAALVLAQLWLGNASQDKPGTSAEISLELGQRGTAPVLSAASDTGLTLRLSLPETSGGPFAIVLLDHGGRPAFETRSGMLPNQKGQLVLHYPLPPPGAYTAEVTDTHGKRWRFPFDIRRPTP